MRRTILAFAVMATASALPAMAQSTTDLVVMRRAFTAPRPKATPTPTPTFTPGTASCDTSKPIQLYRDQATLIATTTGKTTVAAAVAWCESQQVTKQYSACYYDGSNGANFSQWSGAPVYTSTMSLPARHYTCTKR